MDPSLTLHLSSIDWKRTCLKVVVLNMSIPEIISDFEKVDRMVQSIPVFFTKVP